MHTAGLLRQRDSSAFHVPRARRTKRRLQTSLAGRLGVIPFAPAMVKSEQQTP